MKTHNGSWIGLGVAVVIILGAVVAILYFKNGSATKEAVGSYKDISYSIEGKDVNLGDNTTYFGNELRTDLNGDGREDVAFIVTQSPGGSGTFYYAVAALNTEKGYVGSDGYLLGDRIAPQSTNVSPNPNQKYVVVFNYADRALTDPMTTRPSIGKSAYLKLDTQTMQWGVVEPNFEGESR